MRRRQFLQAASLASLVPLVGGPARTAEKPPGAAPAAKFRLGLVTYNLAADWTLSELLKTCKAAGIAPVELRTTHKHGVEPSLTKERRKEVRKQIEDSGVEFWGCGSVCEFHAPNQEVVNKHIED